MASPRPVPPAAVLLGSVARVPKRSNARSRSAGGTPGPSSAISSRQRAVGRGGPDPDRAAVGTVAHGVVEQVDDQLAQPGPVGPHGQARRRRRRAKLTARPVGTSSATVSSSRSPDVDVAEPQRRDAGVDPRQLEQVADQVGEAPGLADRRLEVLLVGRHDAVGEVLQDGGQAGQRGAQLVGDGGDQGALLLVDRVQLGGHLVERAGQLADLVGRLRADPAAVVAAGHPPRGLGHLAQRRHHPGGEQLGHAECQRDGHRQRQEQRYAGPRSGQAPISAAATTDARRPERRACDLDRADRIERPGGVRSGSRA